MSYEYSLVGVFPENTSALDAVRKAAEALGVDPSTVPSTDPRFEGRGLLVFADETDEYDRKLTRRYFDFESDFSLVFSMNTGSADETLIIRVVQNILRICLAFAQDSSFRGELVDDYTDGGYLVHISGGVLTLNEKFWAPWVEAPKVLTVVPEPHHFADLRLSRFS